MNKPWRRGLAVSAENGAHGLEDRIPPVAKPTTWEFTTTTLELWQARAFFLSM
jgi:hypothetical protein